MRSEKLVHEQKKEFLDFLTIDEALEKEMAWESIMPFFAARSFERGEISKPAEEFPSLEARESDFTTENQLKKKLFWIFMEYFFLSSKVPLKDIVEGLERNIILRTLYKVNGNQKKAAHLLNVKYSTLNEKVKRYKIRFHINPF